MNMNAAEDVFRKRIESWCDLVTSHEKADSIRVHLKDLRNAGETLAALIAELPEIDPDDQVKVRKALLRIQFELYDHMKPHMDELFPGLDAVIDSLYES
jgi:hypothetical protein